MNLAKKLRVGLSADPNIIDADMRVDGVTPKGLVVDLPKDGEIPSWQIDEIDVTRLYPSWESTICPGFVLDTLPKIGAGKLFQGCEAWTVFNVGHHKSSFGYVPLPKTIDVVNRSAFKANTRINPAVENKPYQWTADVVTVSEDHYYFFLLDDYSLFGYRPFNRTSFNMPNNVLAMMTFKVTTELKSGTSEFEVIVNGGFDLDKYYGAYYANRPPIEMLGVDDV